MDDGLGGSFSEVNVANDPTVINNPNLNEFTITNFPVGSLGRIFRIYLTATNREDTTDSSIVSIMLAEKPH